MGKAIAEARGKEWFGPGGGRNAHAQAYANPLSLALDQPGGRMPQTVEGGLSGFGMPSNFQGQPIPMDPNYAIKPGKHAGDLHLYKYGGGRRDSLTGSLPRAKNWHEGWYQPYVQARVEAPIRQIIGGPEGQFPGFAIDRSSRGYAPQAQLQAMINPQKTEFKPVTDVLEQIPEAEQLWESLNPVLTEAGNITKEMGYDVPVIPKRGQLATDLKSMAIKENIAKAEHEAALEGFETEELDADIAKDEELKSIKEERKAAVQSSLPALEKAAAKQATTGMAHSGPASGLLEKTESEEIMDLLQIKKKEQDIVKDYHEDMADIEERRDEAIAARQVERGGMVEDIGGKFGELATEAQELGNLGYDILEGHQQYGQSLQGSGLGAYVGQNRYGGGAFGSGNTWGEMSTPEAERLYEMGEETATFAEDVQSAAMNEALAMIQGLEELA